MPRRRTVILRHAPRVAVRAAADDRLPLQKQIDNLRDDLQTFRNTVRRTLQGRGKGL